MIEMKESVPDVLDVIVTIAVPQIKGDCEQTVPQLCTAYGILMNSRWKELSLIQKVNGILLGAGNANEKVTANTATKFDFRVFQATCKT